MAYNYPPPGSYGRPPSYGAFPPNMGPPPGMGGAPGMSPPPGLSPAQTPVSGRPGSIAAPFQPPQNLPDINFNAPVIRLGVGAGAKPQTPYGYDSRAQDSVPSNRPRLGLGADQRMPRESVQLIPPTMEEVRRTIFVGGLVEGTPDDLQLEDVMGAGGQGPVKLRRWTRVTDADGKPCKFGFAEYEDAGALQLASEIFNDIEVPLRENGKLLKDEDGNVKKAKLMVVVDPKSLEYIDQWSKPSSEELQFRLDTAKDDLHRVLAHLSSQDSLTNGSALDQNGDTVMDDGHKPDGAEVITIPVSAEDELSDIPADMRETVAAEIAAFRDRSIQRDLERLRKEEEMEAAERQRSAPRPSRLASPPLSAPSAPGGANGVPVGPRDRTVAGAPAGPKGYRGAQMPKDYADGVNFVNGINHEDEEDPASDSELERRREEKKNADLEKVYLDQERRWLNVERRHIQALARADAEEEAEQSARQQRRDALAQKFKEFDDEEELRRPTELFYRDRKAWIRARRDFKHAERARDDKDRSDESKERAREQRKLDAARGMADNFLAEAGQELSARGAAAAKPAQRAFTLNLGGMGGGRAAREDSEEPEEQKQSTKQTMADMEGLLDDEDEALGAGERKPLRTVDFQPLAAGEKMTDSERREATRALASSIPTTNAELFAWPVKWSHLPDTVLRDQLRPYVQKKIFESLGVAEEMLVEVIESVIRRKGRPEEIIEELSDTLDEDAEGLTRKVWRMVVFFSESEARGLGMQ